MDINQKRRLMIIGALVVLLGVSVYEHGLNVLWVSLVAVIAGLIVELLSTKLRKENYDFTSYFISPLVIGLIVSDNLVNHVWMVAVGVMFGLFFAKALFGGQDKNVFNAEALGLIFIIMSFPSYLLNQKTGNATGELFLYTVLGLSVLLMLFKAVSTYTVIGYLLSLLGLYGLFYLTNSSAIPPLDVMVGHNMIFVGVFMATEKSTNAKSSLGQLIYGVSMGLFVWLINTQSSNKEFAAIYAVLLANAISPLIDQFVSSYISKTDLKEVTQ